MHSSFSGVGWAFSKERCCRCHVVMAILHKNWLLSDNQITKHSNRSEILVCLLRKIIVLCQEKKNKPCQRYQRLSHLQGALLSTDVTQTFGKIWVCGPDMDEQGSVQLTWNYKLERETMFACCQRSCKRGNSISRWCLDLRHTSECVLLHPWALFQSGRIWNLSVLSKIQEMKSIWVGDKLLNV